MRWETDDWVLWILTAVVGAFLLLVGYAIVDEEFLHPCVPRDICDHYESVTGTGVSAKGDVVVTSGSVCTRSHVGVGSRCKEGSR